MVKGNITTAGHNLATDVAFKNCAPFSECIIKFDGTTKHDVEDLDLAMPLYNLIEKNSNYFETAGALWFYSKDEATNFNADIANNNTFKSLTIRLNY